MKKIYFISCLIISFNITNSQNKTGVIYYGEIQSLGLGNPIGKDYNALLVFDKEKSLYITRQDSLEALSSSNSEKKYYFAVSSNKKGFQYYNHLKGNKFYSRDIGFNYVKEETPKISWAITNETKSIGKFLCYKATATFRGRNYTAWFTTIIPLPFGPWKLQGLPGLILEAYDTHKEIFWYFKEIEYPTTHRYLLKPIINPNKEWMSFTAYKSKLIESDKNAIIRGRVMTEKLGIKNYNTIDNTSSSFIEVFKIDDN